MNKQEKAQKILQGLAKVNGFNNWDEIITDYNNGFTTGETLDALVIAAIVEAMDAPAKEAHYVGDRPEINWWGGVSEKDMHQHYEDLAAWEAKRSQLSPAPAKEDVVSIYRFQLKAIESTLFTIANQYKCREQKTCLDRMVTQAEQFATNALKGEMDKTVRYGQALAAPAKEVEAISDSDWKQLRDKFFKECTETYEAGKGLNVLRKVSYNIAPHDLFEWFKRELTAKEAISVPAQQGVKWIKADKELPKLSRNDLPVRINGSIECFADFLDDTKVFYVRNGDVKLTYGRASYSKIEWRDKPAQPLQPSLEEKKEDLVVSEINTDVSSVVSLTASVGNSIEQEAWNWWRELGEQKRLEIGSCNYGKTITQLYLLFKPL